MSERRIEECINCGRDTIWERGSEPCICYPCAQKLKGISCITYISSGTTGLPFVIYLRDGTKITVGRDKTTKGRAWLEVSRQAVIKACGTFAGKDSP